MSDASMGTQIVSWLSLGLGIVGLVIGAINHKRIRSTCCRHEASVSLDIESTSPKVEEKKDAPPKSPHT